MKTNIIQTGACTLFFAELPEGAINIQPYMGYITARVPNYDNWATDEIIANPIKCAEYVENHKPENDYKDFALKLPDGEWKLLCKADEVTEEISEWVVKRETFERCLSDLFFRSYTKDRHHCESALQSYESLLEANGIYFDNPLEINMMDGVYEMYQSKVFNKQNTYIFKKL